MWLVALQERVDQSFALETVDLLLTVQRAGCRLSAERLAFDRPVAVVLALEIGQYDGRPVFQRTGTLLGDAEHGGRPGQSPDAVYSVARSSAGRPQTDCILQPTGQGGFDRLGGSILDGELHYGGRQRGVGRVQWNERRECLEPDRNGKAVVRIIDRPDRILAAKTDVRKTVGVQRPRDGLAVGQNANRKALLDRRRRLVRFSPVSVAGRLLVEDIPMGQASVAGQIELSGTQSTHRHADGLQVGSVVDGSFPFGRECLDPFGGEFLVRRNEMVGNVLLVERTGDGLQTAPGCREHTGPHAGNLDELASAHRRAAATTGRLTGFLPGGGVVRLRRRFFRSVVVSHGSGSS